MKNTENEQKMIGPKFEGDSVEWFEAEGHVFDLTGISESDRAALEKLKEEYDRADQAGKHRLRGMLHLLEDGLTNGYLSESAEVLARIWDLMKA
jgi:hypothetical protein